MNLKQKYAALLVRQGVNIQKGQTFVLSCPIEVADFGRLLQEEAYKAGAREVVMRWIDEKSLKISYDMADDAIFDEVAPWVSSFYNGYVDQKAAFMTIVSDDPELMKDVDPKRIARAVKARSIALEHFRNEQMSGRNAWCVAAASSEGWARKVFPKDEPEVAVKKLWDAIYKATRVDCEDPFLEWEKHQENFERRTKILNDYAFTHLEYKNSLGTDLRVALAKGHLWLGGSKDSETGYPFNANMPTEEVFTAPDAKGTDGRIYSSIPLNYQGNLIDKFWFEIEDGFVVDFGAEKGAENLKQLLETDEGAKRLGEVALVSYDSPISNTGILFYNTLFDENASCHFALGKAYASCLEGGKNMNAEEQKKAGINDSFIHVDFMVGTKDLEIDGILASGEKIPVFRDGNFVF